MNLDPETLFALLEPVAPVGSALSTTEMGSDQTRLQSIVGDHFFWARTSVPADLSQLAQVCALERRCAASADAALITGEECAARLLTQVYGVSAQA